MRQLDQLAELGVKIRFHAQLAELEFHGPLVQQSHDDPFAVDHGDHGDADIDLAPARAELDAAVLRQTPLGNVQPRHDFQAADDGRLKAVDLRWHGLYVQNAVDTMAHAQTRLLRLDVNVAGPQIDRLQQDLVDQPHHRGFLGLRREFGVGINGLVEFDAVVGLGQEAVDRFAAHAQVRLDPLGNLLAAGQNGHHRQACGHAQLVQGVQVERIAGGDDEAAVVAADGEERFAMHEARREIFQKAEVDLGIDQVDELQPYLVGQCPQGRFLAEEAELHGRLIEPHAVSLGGPRLFELLGIQQPFAKKHLAHVHGIHRLSHQIYSNHS